MNVLPDRGMETMRTLGCDMGSQFSCMVLWPTSTDEPPFGGDGCAGLLGSLS